MNEDLIKSTYGVSKEAILKHKENALERIGNIINDNHTLTMDEVRELNDLYELIYHLDDTLTFVAPGKR